MKGSFLSAAIKDLQAKVGVLKAEGRLAEAIEVQQKMTRLAPQSGAVWHNLAASLGDAGRNKECADAAERAFASGLDAPETWLVYARALVGTGRLSKAQDAFENVIKRRPLETAAHRELSQLIWMRTGDAAEALKVLDKTISQNPRSIELLLTRAHIVGQTGDAEGEYDIVLDALRRSGGAPMLELAATNSALAAERYEAALEHARRALASEPGAQQMRQAYCRALLATGGAKEAVPIAESLHAEFPLDQHVIAVMATAWRLAGDDRYPALYDYDAFVVGGELDAPKGWGSLEAYVDDLVAALDKHHKFSTHPFSQSVRHGSQLSSIDQIDEPPLKAFPEAAAGPIRRYMERAGAGNDPLRRRNGAGHRLYSAWSIRLPASGFHIDHVHRQGWLSSACHLRLPEISGDDPRAGWLKFGQPGIPTEPALEPEHFVEPQIGRLVIFPSYMWHGTVPFSGERSRLTVAVDILPGD